MNPKPEKPKKLSNGEPKSPHQALQERIQGIKDLETRRAKLKKLSIKDLRGKALLFEESQKGESDKIIVEKQKKDSATMVALYTNQLADGRFELNYKQYLQELTVGLGELFGRDPDNTTLEVEQNGQKYVVYRDIVPSGKHKGRLGYVTKPDPADPLTWKYFPTFTGDIVRVLSKEETDAYEDDQKRKAYVEQVKEDAKKRAKYTKRSATRKTKEISRVERRMTGARITHGELGGVRSSLSQRPLPARPGEKAIRERYRTRLKDRNNKPAYKPELIVQADYKVNAEHTINGVTLTSDMSEMADREASRKSSSTEIAKRPYLTEVTRYVGEYLQIPGELIIANAYFEAGGKLRIIGDKGKALGLAQAWPSTREHMHKNYPAEIREIMGRFTNDDPKKLERASSVLFDVLCAGLLIREGIKEYKKRGARWPQTGEKLFRAKVTSKSTFSDKELIAIRYYLNANGWARAYFCPKEKCPKHWKPSFFAKAKSWYAGKESKFESYAKYARKVRKSYDSLPPLNPATQPEPAEIDEQIAPLIDNIAFSESGEVISGGPLTYDPDKVAIFGDSLMAPSTNAAPERGKKADNPLPSRADRSQGGNNTRTIARKFEATARQGDTAIMNFGTTNMIATRHAESQLDKEGRSVRKFSKNMTEAEFERTYRVTTDIIDKVLVTAKERNIKIVAVTHPPSFKQFLRLCSGNVKQARRIKRLNDRLIRYIIDQQKEGNIHSVIPLHTRWIDQNRRDAKVPADIKLRRKDYESGDGVHLTPKGQKAYRNAILDAFTNGESYKA